MEINESQFLKIVDMQVQMALWECCHPTFIEEVLHNKYYKNLIDEIFSDAVAFSHKDPASKNHILSILQNYTSFKAVTHYRVSNFIYKNLENSEKEFFALFISNRGKLLSGADIHFKAEIGQDFVLDHGYGTVIGETSKIGDGCYFLGGIILGANGIANNDLSKRHPNIGNNVEIGAFSRIFGNVSIGNNVFIGSNCVIVEDIPSDSKVVSRSYNQITRH